MATSPLIEEIKPKNICDTVNFETPEGDVIQEAINCVNTPSKETEGLLLSEQDNNEPLGRQLDAQTSVNNDSEHSSAPS